MPDRGRAVFAVRDLPAGSEIHVSDEPLAYVVCAAYRKEACATCFACDLGRKLPHVVMAAGGGKAGVAWFCSAECKAR